MKTVTAHEAVRNFSALIDSARNAPVEITRHKRTIAVVISPAEYRAFARLKEQALMADIEKTLEEIANAPANDHKAVRVLAGLMRRAKPRQ